MIAAFFLLEHYHCVGSAYWDGTTDVAALTIVLRGSQCAATTAKARLIVVEVGIRDTDSRSGLRLEGDTISAEDAAIDVDNSTFGQQPVTRVLRDHGVVNVDGTGDRIDPDSGRLNGNMTQRGTDSPGVYLHTGRGLCERAVANDEVANTGVRDIDARLGHIGDLDIVHDQLRARHVLDAIEAGSGPIDRQVP